jgi:outer membrane receptor for ferrienterochelin and colicins
MSDTWKNCWKPKICGRGMGRVKVRMYVTLGVLILTCGTAFVPTATASQEDTDDTDVFDMSLEELTAELQQVYTASKYSQNVKDAPASITIVTSEEISRYGYRTLAEILNSVPGFYMGYDRAYNSMGIRGFKRPGDYDTRMLVLLDGHRLNENIYDSPSLGTEAIIDIDLIHRIEIIHGPGSSLYGSSALLGVVNIITKSAENQEGLQLSGELASHDAKRGRLSYGHLFNEDAHLFVSATQYDSPGRTLYFPEFDTPATFNGKANNNHDEFYNVFVRASVGEVSLTAAHTSRIKGIPNAPWGTVFGDTRTDIQDKRTVIGLTHDHTLTEKVNVTSRVSYSQTDFMGEYAYDYGVVGAPDIVTNRDASNGRWWEGEFRVVAETSDWNKLIGGLEGRYNAQQDQFNYDSGVYYLNDKRDSDNWGIYLQDELKVSEQLTAIGGVRYDEYSTFGHSVNPRAALIYHAFEDTVFKFLYGQVFRAPNPYEFHYNDGGFTTKAALSLEAESIETYEIVCEQQLAPNVTATVSGFHFEMDDLIDQFTDPADGLLVFKNLNQATSSGVEVGVTGMWDSGLKGRCSYTYTET